MKKFINKIKEVWSIYKSFKNIDFKVNIREIIEVLTNAHQCIILFTESENKEQNDIIYYSSGEDVDIEFSANAKNVIKDDLVQRLQQEYENNIEHYDYDLAMAYKEIDYQMARANYLQAELDYYKEINTLNPNMNADGIKRMWDNVERLKKIYESF